MAAQLYIAAGIAAAAFAAGGGIAWTVQGYRLDACSVKSEVLAADLEEQDKAVEDLAEQGRKDQESLAKALESAQGARKAAAARVAVRSASKAPDSCDAAIALTDAEK